MLVFLRRIGHFILHYNFFIAACAVAMSFESVLLLNSTGMDLALLVFIFFVTLFAYNFYYIKSRFHAWSPHLSLISAPLALISFVLSHSISYPVLGLVCFLALLYTLPGLFELRYTPSIKLLRLFLLTLTWTLATFALPLAEHAANATYWVLLAYRFLLLWNLSFMFFIRDEEHSFNARNIQRSFWLGLLAQGIFAALMAASLYKTAGMAYLLAWLLQCIVSVRLSARRHPNQDYLLYVDGIMPAQTIFVMLFHTWQPF